MGFSSLRYSILSKDTNSPNNNGYGQLKLTWIHKYLLLPILVFNSSPLERVSEHYSCLTEFRYFIHPNTLNWAQRFIETCFKEEKIKNALKGNSQWTTSQQKTDWNPGTHIKKFLDHCRTFPLYPLTCPNHTL